MKKLESILKNDFYPQFCFEDIFGTILDTRESEMPIPMVCFCDIPLSQVSKHIQTYGDYAVGMSKEWAIKNKINPVLYTYPNSDFSTKLKEMIFTISKYAKENQGSKDELTKHFLSAILYVKPYEGRLWKNGKWSKKKIRFYDEREWRYVLRIPGSDRPLFLAGVDSRTKEAREKLKKFNEVIINNSDLRLSFQPNDIKYLIVKNENEILAMLDKVTKIKRHKFSHEAVQILTTRIISMENIRENF